jgi:uncharacterized repeat protein (TIGR01451 family)
MRVAVSLLACLLALMVTVVLVVGLHQPARAGPSPSETTRVLIDPGDVVINEVAWMGTTVSASDEWIELYNTTSVTVPLEGWRLVDDDHLDIPLDGQILPQGYYLIERTDDDAVSDLAADWSGSFGLGGLSNAGQVLTMTDGLSQVIDTANGDGGEWPAGTASEGMLPYATMERIDPLGVDGDSNWCTNDGLTRNGVDAGGHAINGTPKAQNSCYQPPIPPTADLVVTKTGALTAYAGDLITYHIILANSGTTTASATLLTDTLSSSVCFVTQTGPFPFTSLGRHLVWELGDVAVGTTHLITAVGSVSEAVSGPLVNVVSATTRVSETKMVNNSASHTTTIRPAGMALFPLILRQYTPPRYGTIIEAVLYDGLQYSDYDEAVLLRNGRDRGVDLTGWTLCKWSLSDWRCAELPAVEVPPGGDLWLARNETYFARSFGFAPDHVLSGWPRFTNTGDEVAFLDAGGTVRDALVYEDGLSNLAGWEGPPVELYRGSSFALEGQVLYRALDEEDGLPSADTDTAADWAQYVDDPLHGRRVRYPGWDLGRFFKPAVGATGTVTAGIAPDNAYRLVVETIRSARESIEVEAYSLEHYHLVMELVEQARQGVRVRALLEGAPVGGLEDQALWACQQLHATGQGRCAFMVNAPDLGVHDRYTYLHAKFIIVDRERLLVSSQNLNHGSLPDDDKGNGTGGSRGVVLVTDSPEMVTRAVEVFEADCDPENHADVSVWGPDNALGYGPPPSDFVPDRGADWVTYTVRFPETVVAPGSWFELVTAPESALRTSDALLGLVGRAGTGGAVYVEQLYETQTWGGSAGVPNPRLQAYIDAARRGARVRILLNGGMFNIAYIPLEENVETAEYVNALADREGLDMKAQLGDPTEYGIHNKMVLVDLGAAGQYAHVGSINGSETASKVNREMALQVRSSALFDYLHAMFEYDWAHRRP